MDGDLDALVQGDECAMLGARTEADGCSILDR
jgi:hypothetical protein